jgi:hypothetical protein
LINKDKKIGIKAALRLEWLEYTKRLVKSGLDHEDIRAHLHTYLADKKDDGTIAKRGDESRSKAVGMLMNTWCCKDINILGFRDKLINKDDLSSSILAHWVMMSFAYPFWLDIAVFVGRLLSIQEVINKNMVLTRVSETYGDRSAVKRSAQRVIQSFISWGLLIEHDKNCYKCADKILLNETETIFLYECLLMIAKEKLPYLQLTSFPGFFPFSLSAITAEKIVSISDTINCQTYSNDQKYLFV